MTPDRLLDHFDRIADAPDAIPRLRRFILDLAVRGKLVEQDPNDEPASELLKRIQGAKARLVKKQKDTPEMDGTEAFLKVPPNWELIPLIVLGTWAIGSGFPTSEQGNKGGPYFFLKVSDMNLPGNEKYIVSSQNFIDEAAAARMRARIHPPGTIVFPKIGGAIATNKRRILTRGSAIDNNCLGITFWQELPVDWCYLLLTTLDFAQYQAGTAVPALQQGVLEQIPVGLPPLAEQYRIVAKVAELMALCDRLEAAQAERESRRDRLAAASLHRLNNAAEAEEFREHARFHLNRLPCLATRPEHIQQLRQTILNLAVRGQLVPQDPNDEPASELLKRIQAEKARLIKEKKLKPQKSLLPIQEGDAPFGVPVGWSWVKADDISLNITDGFHNTPSPTAAGRPYITAKHIRPLNIDFDTCLYVDEKNHRELFAKTRVKRGDILIVNIGAGCGTPALIDVDFEFSFKNVAIMNLPTGLDQNYVLQFLMYYRILVFEDLIKGGAQPFLGLGMLREMLIPLPPRAEQHRIVAKVEELMALCDRLEAQITTAQTESRRVIEAVLHEALSSAG